MTTNTETTDRIDPSSGERTSPTGRANPNFIDNDLDRTPETTFRDYGLDDRLVDALEAQGIVHPFPIQELTLPVALTGQDIIGQARTGTGKTLGFGLPMIHRLDPEADHTQALIVTPTRELCIQVHDQLRICEAVGLGSTTVYGGVGYEEQTDALEAGVDIVVGTPGRLLDMLGRGILDLSRVSCVILDEADEMLDMGFLPDVERLLDAANPDGDRHTMLFSATMPASVVKLARRYTEDPLFMGADSVQHETAPTVEQHFFQVYRMDKPRVLARILQQPDRGNAYVFTRTKAMADRLVRELGDLGVDAIAIHGDLRQAAREKNLTRFRDGRTSVLCATEVAARGIDVDNVTHVFNYDIPDDEKMYLHRIGRTARAGNEGVAVTFAEHNELARLAVIQRAVQQDDMDELVTHEVFSTSDLLTELFDLPEATPWDHMGTSDDGGGRGDRSRGGGRRSNGDSRSRTRSSQRSRDRVEHDSGDDDGRDRERSRTVVRSDEGRRERPARSRRTRDDRAGQDEGSRQRSRSRSRTRDDDGSRDGSGDGDDASATTRRDDAGDGGRGQRSGGTTRTTGGARVRARRGKPVDPDRRDADRSSTDSRRRSANGDRGRSDEGASRSRERNRGGATTERGGRGADSNDRSGARGGSSTRRGGGGSRSGGSRSGASGSGASGSGSRGGASGARDGRVSLPSEVRPTRPGPEARGEGTPRHGRSVHVDDLV